MHSLINLDTFLLHKDEGECAIGVQWPIELVFIALEFVRQGNFLVGNIDRQHSPTLI